MSVSALLCGAVGPPGHSSPTGRWIRGCFQRFCVRSRAAVNVREPVPTRVVISRGRMLVPSHRPGGRLTSSETDGISRSGCTVSRPRARASLASRALASGGCRPSPPLEQARGGIASSLRLTVPWWTLMSAALHMLVCSLCAFFVTGLSNLLLVFLMGLFAFLVLNFESFNIDVLDTSSHQMRV